MFPERELNTADYILCICKINITLSCVHKTSQYVEEDLNKMLLLFINESSVQRPSQHEKEF